MEGKELRSVIGSGSQPINYHRLTWLLAAVFSVMALLVPARGWLLGAAQSLSEARSVRFALDEANGSGLTARVKLIDMGGQTRVVVALRGVEDGEYLPHIHSGECGAYDGTPTWPLALFTAGERSRTSLDISFDDLVAGDYLIDIHPVATTVDALFDPDTALVCGQVTGPDALAEASPTPSPDKDDFVVTRAPDTGVGPIPDQYWSTILISTLALLAAISASAGLDLRRRTALTIAQRRLIRLTGRQL